MRRFLAFLPLALVLFPINRAAAEPPAGVTVKQTDDAIQIDTDALQARIRKKGYVSGVEAGTLLDKKTGAREVGFGLHIMDFLLAPGWADDGYPRDPKLHGDLPKHYVEGPQICTQAKELASEVIEGKDFVAVRLSYHFTKPAKGFKAGSIWEQTLVFQPGVRYFLCGERITSVNDVDDLFYRIDMPGHIRHKGDDTFSQVYLSYRDQPIPASEFADDFAPDAKFLVPAQRRQGSGADDPGVPAESGRQAGSVAGGMTFDPAEVSEAWCHQRGYVCFIQEMHRRKVKAGETFGAAYAVGYFDDIASMEKLCDRYKNCSA